MPSLQHDKHYNFEDLKTRTLPHLSFSSSLLCISKISWYCALTSWIISKPDGFITVMYILMFTVSFADFPNKTKIKIISPPISHVLVVMGYSINVLYHSQGNQGNTLLSLGAPLSTCPPSLVLPASALIAPTQNITVSPYPHPTWLISFPTPNNFCFSQSQPAFWIPVFGCNWDFGGIK